MRVIRAAREGDLHELLELYLALHEDTVPEDSEYLSETWERMLGDPYHHVIVTMRGCMLPEKYWPTLSRCPSLWSLVDRSCHTACPAACAACARAP